MTDTFLSYNENDRDAVRRLAEALESTGWSVWWDRRIPAGLTWRGVLERELRHMRCMVVLWSQHSVARDWVCEEAAEGRQLGKLVPVLLEGVRPPPGAGRNAVQHVSGVFSSGVQQVNTTTRFTLVTIIGLLSACGGLQSPAPAPAAAAATPAPVAAAAAPAPPPPPVLPYDEAVLSAATALLKGAKLPPEGAEAQPRYTVVIDPLIDGFSHAQSAATRSMGLRLAALMREQYPQYDVQPFSAANVARNPLVLIGTFTPVNAQRQTSGTREAYRICFALADLKSGKLVSKGLAFSKPDGVDATPTASYRDAPAWTEDPATLGYIRTCQGTKAGDPINPLYTERIAAAALVAEAIEAYDAGRYQQSLDLYTNAQRTSAGDQFRVYNGVYLANWKLGRRDKAEAAFGKIVDYGLARQRLAVKFLFRPGSTAFGNDAKLTGPYPVWLKAIAARASSGSSCLEVTGHTSATGPEPLNERLSLLRAEYVKSQLEANVPALAKRTIAAGMGSRQTMVGSGRDDASDALDRRVEFKVIGC